MKTINVIGCGNVGKTLCRLWTRHNLLEVRSVLNRSRQSGASAVDFVGEGRAVDDYSQLERTDLTMISTSDESIETCCRRLVDSGILAPGTIVFHTSGSLPSSLLDPARSRGASIAGLHPVKSFADPERAVESFSGTFCAVEGDAAAREVLSELMHRCGAITFDVSPESKTVYHAATVFASNYLVALLEIGLRCFERAGISRETALKVMDPIVSGTARNVIDTGPVAALTGPIARGELSVVQRQAEALGDWDGDIQRLYAALGRVAVELSAAQGNAQPEALDAINIILKPLVE